MTSCFALPFVLAPRARDVLRDSSNPACTLVFDPAGCTILAAPTLINARRANTQSSPDPFEEAWLRAPIIPKLLWTGCGKGSQEEGGQEEGCRGGGGRGGRQGAGEGGVGVGGGGGGLSIHLSYIIWMLNADGGHTQESTCGPTHVSLSLSLCVYIYIYTYIFTHTNHYIYIYIHTYILYTTSGTRHHYHSCFYRFSGEHKL